MVFLIISQNSQENTSVSVSVLIKMTLYCEICEIFKKTFLQNTPRLLLLNQTKD